MEFIIKVGTTVVLNVFGKLKITTDGLRPSRDYIFTSPLSYADHSFSIENYSVALAKKSM